MEFRALAIRQAHQNHAADVAEGIENPKTVQEYFDAFIGEGEADAVTMLARQSLMEQAQDFADVVTFQKEMGPIGEGFAALANKHIAGRFILPFVRTPSNIIRETIKRSPLELMAIANTESSLMRAIKEGGAERDLAMAQIALGGAAMGMMMMATTSGYVTGTPPEDKVRREALERLHYQWHSINISAMERGDARPQETDYWVSFDRLDPIGSLVGMAVDTTYIMGTTDPSDEETFLRLPTAMVQSLAVNVTSKTYLRGLSDFIQFMTDPTGWKGVGFVERQAVSFIPNALNQPGQAVDPYRRDAEGFIEKAKLRSGFYRGEVPEMLDRWGRKVEDNPLGFWGMFFPGYIKEAKPNPVDEEIVRLSAELPPDVNIQGLGTGSFEKIGDLELTDDQRAEYLGMAGGYAYDMLEAIITRSEEGFINAVERIGKDIAKGTEFDGRSVRMSKKDAKAMIDAYYIEEAYGAEGLLPNTAKASMISTILKDTKEAARFNMAKKNPEIWAAMIKEGVDMMTWLENAPNLEVFGIDRDKVREQIMMLQQSRERL
jgi:hypothetical protein